MEHIASLTDSLKLSGRSTKPEHEAKAKLLLKEAQRRFPNQQIPADSISAFKQDWAELIAEFGEAVFERKLKTAMRDSQFFPSVKAIIDAEPWSAGKEKAKRCSRCEANCGWLYVLVDGSPRAEVIKCPHDTQIKFTVHKRDIHGNPFSREATACDSVPA